MKWNQAAWYTRKDGSKTCWRWVGTRKDGRGFKIVFVKGEYVCLTFNGAKLGAKSTLAAAQKLAESAPEVVLQKTEVNQAVM